MFGIDLGNGLQTEWFALLVALILLITAVLRLVTVMIQTADAAGRLKEVRGTVVGALVWTLAFPGRGLQGLAGRRGAWGGVFHPFGLVLAFCSAALAWLMSSIPDLSQWSGRASWVLVAGLVGYVACAGVVSIWPASPRGMQRLRKARNGAAGQISARIRSSPPGARAQLERLRAASLACIDDEIVPPFVQLMQRNAGVRAEILAYQRSSAEPDEDVLARLQAMRAQYEKGTAACAQQAVDAEARLFALLQERDDAALSAGLRGWVDDLQELVEALALALIVPPWPVPSPRSAPPGAVQADDVEVSIKPPPADFADLTRRALRALNKPGTLANSGLIPVLPLCLREVWQRAGEGQLANPTPLEQSQALRTVLVHTIEGLNVSDDGGAQAHQHQVLHMQYVLGLTVVQVAIRLQIADQSVFRRSAEGVDAVANDLWRREQLLAGRGPARHYDPVALDYLG